MTEFLKQPSEENPLPPQTQEFLDDRSVDIEQRIDLARLLSEKYGELSILLARSGASDGMGFSDKHISKEQVMEFAAAYGFDLANTVSVSNYEWRTPSTIHPDLTFHVQEGPIEIGAATELFPSGKAWSQYDYVNTSRILVSPAPGTI